MLYQQLKHSYLNYGMQITNEEVTKVFWIMLTYVVVVTLISTILMIVCTKTESTIVMTVLEFWMLSLIPITITFIMILLAVHVARL